MKRLLYAIPLGLAVGLLSTVSVLATNKTDQSNVPTELRVPDGHKRVLTSVGRGVQIYDCADGAWKFRAPRADIFRDKPNDKLIAIHYAGPTWESTKDGSKVVATVHARRDAPSPQRDIPWLLLKATPSADKGVFGDVDYIQRLDTDGGVAPSGACAAGQTAEVPYVATYVFWAPSK